MNFLGHRIDKNGIRPNEEKVRAIVQMNRPELVMDMKRFLNMINYYRRFIPNAAEHQGPLQQLIPGNKKRDRSIINWTEQGLAAFARCKKDIQETTYLAHPPPDAKLQLVTDASDFAAGGVVNLLVDRAWKPAGFFSKRFTESQKNYSTYDRELLAIHLSVKHFRYMLEGREFHIVTDHKPLVYAFSKSRELTPRNQRALEYISQFSTDIRHIAGESNVTADCLSRAPIETISVNTGDWTAFADEQEKCQEVQRMIATPSERTSLLISNKSQSEQRINLSNATSARRQQDL